MESSRHDLGRRIIEKREILGLSLRALAAQAGVSPSFLSQLERGLTDASVASLRKIADALSTSIADLLDPSPKHSQGVLRADQRPSTPLSSGSEKFVVSLPPIKNVEIYIGRFSADGATGQDPYVHGKSQEFLIVLEGKVLLELGSESYTLGKHDSIEYLSSVPHRVQNIGGTDAEVMWITSPPTTSSTVVRNGSTEA